ncbi:hypothetical protein BKP45_11740 [Anaerobacillus alkalidiazotrophicus]|uniref:ABC transporter substrate-binding protein n=1 Tax=Anaerobacillus alkalidiazotrophicus TaxID=472963 RepID=A0A1S2M173_9BACI|nr:EcsC family protein [Anaerobacillus alkalidiazotrophicus]OIJ18250.1 hypothetical protein BKP45_17455 [Anaerobacillus alkalidiazotrophicus]OIJ19729.1 hypothetical protein BKP45_11740 [Anaerobacillus alkalidiazotrophicus]
MELKGRKKNVWEEIKKWEHLYFDKGETNSLNSFEENFNNIIKSWRPEVQKKLLQAVDSMIFHTYSIIQDNQFDQKTISKILEQGRVFRSDVENINDMKKLTIDQLRYITNKFLAKQRLVSLTQGGTLGIGGLPLVVLDLPLLLLVNLRSIQLTAMTYGYDLRKPYEVMLALKVFHVSTLPKTLQKQGWNKLLLELDSCEDEWIFFDEKTSGESLVCLQQPIKQLTKGLLVLMLKKKTIQGVPILGIAAGASANYFFTKQVSNIAHNFYQKRFLLEEKMISEKQ